jgi:uncharacterized protein YkwD
MIRRSIIGAGLALPALLASAPVRAQEAPPEVAGILPESTPETEAAEFTVVNLINLLRLGNGRQPLEMDTALTEIARIRSGGLAQRLQDDLSHEIPGVGFGPLWILDHLVNAIGSGENLGLTDDDNSVAMHKLFDAWVASPTHLENLLRGVFTHIGVGVVEIPAPVRAYPGRTLKYVTQVFAIATGPLVRV